MFCSAPACGRDFHSIPHVTLFSLPRDRSVRNEWLEILGIKHQVARKSRIKVCETHFRPKDFCAGKRKRLKSHAVPVLQVGGTDPVDSDDEFRQCDPDSDLEIIEVKGVTVSEPAVKKIKVEPEMKKAEPKEEPVMPVLKPKTKILPKMIKTEPKEDEPPPLLDSGYGRRPSRRAAVEAAKKISNSVRSFSVLGMPSDKVTQVPQTHPLSPENRKPRVKAKPLYVFKVLPPADIGLNLECHEEDLSTVQIEALLKASSEYNKFIQTLQHFREDNYRIFYKERFDDLNSLPVFKKSTVATSKHSAVTVASVKSKAVEIKQPNVITVTPIKVTSSIPIRLTKAFSPVGPSSPTPILSLEHVELFA